MNWCFIILHCITLSTLRGMAFSYKRSLQIRQFDRRQFHFLVNDIIASNVNDNKTVRNGAIPSRIAQKEIAVDTKSFRETGCAKPIVWRGNWNWQKLHGSGRPEFSLQYLQVPASPRKWLTALIIEDSCVGPKKSDNWKDFIAQDKRQ